MRTALGGMMLLLLVTGCGESAKQMKQARQSVDTNRGAMEARLKLMEEFATKVEKKEASSAKFELPPDVKLKISTGYAAPGNTLLVHLREFRRELPRETVYGESGIILTRNRSLLEGVSSDNFKTAEEDIQGLISARYLGIVQELSKTIPTPNKEDKTFTPGKIEFRIHFYDLIDKKELGGLTCTAETSDSITASKGSEYSKLESDLSVNANKAKDAALQPFQ